MRDRIASSAADGRDQRNLIALADHSFRRGIRLIHCDGGRGKEVAELRESKGYRPF
jgi:hypothetical protein